jgi:archaeal flagellar protein FlaH
MVGRILFVDRDTSWSSYASKLLQRGGYHTISASNAQESLQKAPKAEPDLILLDSETAGTQWERLVKDLRKQVPRIDTPVILITQHERERDALLRHPLTVNEVLSKPIGADELTRSIKQLLQGRVTRRSVISTGSGEIDNKMGGGIPLGSLTLIEGSSGSGKSVLVQQMIWGSLADNYNLALFTSENTVSSLVNQMESLNLGILDFLLLGRLAVYAIEVSGLGEHAPKLLLNAVKTQDWRDIAFIDSLTAAIANSPPEQVLRFLEECKRLCAQGMTIVVVLHSHSITPDLAIRIRSLCDAHLQLRTEEVGQRLLHMMEVTKVRGADKTTGSIVSFEVEPSWGMRIVPINKVKG